MVEHARGRPRLARQWLEKSLDEAKSLDESTSRALFAADPTVLALGLLAIDLLHLGFVKQARTRLSEAHARARALGQPGPQLAVLWFEGRFEVHMGNAERVADVSQQLLTLVEEHELWPQGRAAHSWFRGWAQAQLGDPRAGYRLIKDGYEQAVRLGIRVWASETLGYAAEALARDGDCCYSIPVSRMRSVIRTVRGIRCGRRWPKRALKRHPGWSSLRSANCAGARTRPLKTDRHWRHWSINFLKQAIRRL
jgi:hypothetical protein